MKLAALLLVFAFLMPLAAEAAEMESPSLSLSNSYTTVTCTGFDINDIDFALEYLDTDGREATVAFIFTGGTEGDGVVLSLGEDSGSGAFSKRGTCVIEFADVSEGIHAVKGTVEGTGISLTITAEPEGGKGSAHWSS